MPHPRVVPALAAVLVLLAPALLPGADAGHIDTPHSDVYTAETLTSARWSVGAIEEEFLGRPFWTEPLTGRGVRVAVIDTGIDASHPDLEGSVVAWRDFLNGRPEPYDDDTHGTHVAGIIAAHGHFQPRPDRQYFPGGARGIAPGVALLIAKTMDRTGDGDAADVARAILWAIDPNGDGDYSDGAHVINLSIGVELPPAEGGTTLPGPVTLPVLQPQNEEEVRIVRNAILTAVRAGAIVVVAAGNHEPGASDAVTFPGTLKEVITVGALDAEGRVARFSNAGAPGSAKPDLVAPGVLLSTFPTDRDTGDSSRDGYVALGGTSMAAPMVAGTVALLLEGDPSLRQLSPTQDLSWHTETIRSILRSTADPVPGATSTTAGAGALDVAGAAAIADTGNGPVNWDVLLLLALIVGLAVLAWYMRRKREERSARLRRLRAEAAARRAAQGDGLRHDDIPVFIDDGEGMKRVDPATATPDTAPTARPEWQAPPWDREEPTDP